MLAALCCRQRAPLKPPDVRFWPMWMRMYCTCCRRAEGLLGSCWACLGWCSVSHCESSCREERVLAALPVWPGTGWEEIRACAGSRWRMARRTWGGRAQRRRPVFGRPGQPACACVSSAARAKPALRSCAGPGPQPRAPAVCPGSPASAPPAPLRPAS
jgi:hypothetical protein